MSFPKSQHHATSPEDRIPLIEKFGFGVGMMVLVGANGASLSLINMVFNMIMGISPALLSTVVFIQTIGSSLLDPFLGQFYDNFRSPWGRRRPLISAALAPMSLLLALIYFFPPGLSERGIFVWLLITLPLFSVAASVYGGPLYALSVEATGDYHERIRLSTYLGFFSAIAGLSTQWIFPLIQNPFFSNPFHGLHCVVGGLAITFFLLGLGPVLLCPEKKQNARTQARPKVFLLESMREAWKNRPFCTVIMVRSGFWFCYSVVGLMGIYMNTYYVYGGDVKKAAGTYAVLGTSYMLASLLSLCFYPGLAQKMGKKRVLQIAVLILMFGCVCKLFVYQASHPWLQLIVLMTNGVASQGVGFVTGTMFGDIIDHDELLYGKRREALYASIQGWFDKIGTSLGGLLCGYVLVAIGFNAKAGVQPALTLQLMKLLYFLLPFSGALFAFLMINRYELSEERVYEIKESLARRRTAIAVEEAGSRL